MIEVSGSSAVGNDSKETDSRFSSFSDPALQIQADPALHQADPALTQADPALTNYSLRHLQAEKLSIWQTADRYCETHGHFLRHAIAGRDRRAQLLDLTFCPIPCLQIIGNTHRVTEIAYADEFSVAEREIRAISLNLRAHFAGFDDDIRDISDIESHWLTGVQG